MLTAVLPGRFLCGLRNPALLFKGSRHPHARSWPFPCPFHVLSYASESSNVPTHVCAHICYSQDWRFPLQSTTTETRISPFCSLISNLSPRESRPGLFQSNNSGEVLRLRLGRQVSLIVCSNSQAFTVIPGTNLTEESGALGPFSRFFGRSTADLLW